MSSIINKTFLQNIGNALFAQLVTFVLNIFMSLFVPKILSIEQFAYWQLFLFYSTYVGLFHFGLTDGVYLVLGGQNLNDIDKKNNFSQFLILLYMQISILIICTSIVAASSMQYERKLVIFCVVIYMLIANLSWFLGYIFQATNNIKWYSFSVVIDKMLFLFLVLASFKIKNINFIYFVITYIFARLVSLIYLILKSKGYLYCKPHPMNIAIKEALVSIKIGINLTLSNICSILTLGVGRMTIDHVWGVQIFGKVSFSLSLTSFFLMFISQLSLVLFPALRRISQEQSKEYYYLFRKILNVILPLIYIAYFPMVFILKIWLPQYTDSLNYLAILLPLCVFDGKMQLLCNTFLKVQRKERVLLKINIVSLIISVILVYIAGFILKNINAVLIVMVLAVALRNILAEIYLSKVYREKNNQTIILLILECVFASFFIFTVNFNTQFLSFIYIVLIYIAYLTFQFKYIKI